MEVVSLSRSKKPTDMAIGYNMNELERAQILNIRKSNIYKDRKKYHSMVIDLAEKTNIRILDQITHLDKTDSDKTFDGGCNVLLEWYEDRVHFYMGQQTVGMDSLG
jgi:hypothetical protein